MKKIKVGGLVYRYIDREKDERRKDGTGNYMNGKQDRQMDEQMCGCLRR